MKSTQPERALVDDAAGSGAHGRAARCAQRLIWLRGPLLVVEDQTTTVAPPAFDVSVDAYGYLVLDRRPAEGAMP